jgi:alkylhydroperoxidase family enzyme
VQELATSDYLTSAHFSPRERAAVLWAEHVAKNTARERDDVFEQVRQHFTDAELVELTDVCGVFAVSNRFQDTMRLPIEEQGEIDKIKSSIRANPERIKGFIETLISTWPTEFPIPFDVGETGRRNTVRNAPTTPSVLSSDKVMPVIGSSRLPLLDADKGTSDSMCFLAAARTLLGGISNAHRIWAHSPHVAKLFLPYQISLEREGAGSILQTSLKIIVLVRTANLNAATYSLAHRTALGRAAGISDDLLAALGADDCVASPLFSERERAALVWANHIADNSAKRREDVFDELKRHFSVAEIVELTGTCAMANRLDLVHNALHVPLESPDEIVALNRSVRLDPARIRGYLQSLLADWPQQFAEAH